MSTFDDEASNRSFTHTHAIYLYSLTYISRYSKHLEEKRVREREKGRDDSWFVIILESSWADDIMQRR